MCNEKALGARVIGENVGRSVVRPFSVGLSSNSEVVLKRLLSSANALSGVSGCEAISSDIASRIRAGRDMSHPLRSIVLTFALGAITAAGPIFAASHGGGHHSGGGHHGGSHTHFAVGIGFGAVYPWGWYGGWPYYPPYYSAPAYYSPPPYYAPPPQQQSYTYYSSQPDNAWYYCAASNAYYPYVTECPGGQWERVQPQAPPPGSDNARIERAP
jgi:hypothetical protein